MAKEDQKAAKAAEQAAAAAQEAEQKRLDAEQAARDAADAAAAEQADAAATAAAKEGARGTLKFATDYRAGEDKQGRPIIKRAPIGTPVRDLKLEPEAVAHLMQNGLIEAE